MRFERLVMAGALCLSLLVATGCGGSNSGSSHSTNATPTSTATPTPVASPTPSAPIAPSARLRAIQPGDQWVYARTDSEKDGVGNSVVSISASKMDDEPILAQSTDTLYGTNKVSGYRFFKQDSNTGDLVVISDDASTSAIYKQPFVFIPGTWSEALNSTFVGDTEIYKVKVVGKERVTVQAGVYDTWRVEQTQQSDQRTVSITYWIAPEIGNYVKYDETQRYNFNGPSFRRITMELKSTNVATISTKQR